MSQGYEEILEGATLPRAAPGHRHEEMCERLHREMASSINGLTTTRLLPARTKVQVLHHTALCPDLALLTTATQRLFLAVEVIDRADHRPDTVIKKELYEKIRVPRLWILDPRYDNVEVYHSMPFGLSLQYILAGREILQEKLIPQFQVSIAELFK